MKNSSYLFLCAAFCFLCNLPLHAQAWLAEGQTWEYEVEAGWDPSLYGKHILRVEGDTTIEGIDCKRIVQYQPNDTEMVYFAYHEQERVYTYDPYLEEFTKLYDFTLSPNDTVFFQGPRKYVIDSVGVTNLAGADRKFQRILLSGNSLDGGTYLLAEGLGLISKMGSSNPDNDCTFFFLQYSFCDAAVDGWSYRFRCFSDGNITYDPFGLCTLNALKDVAQQAELNVFPNPAQSDFTVSREGGIPETGWLSVVDGTGRIYRIKEIKDISLPNTISTEKWPAGTYFILFRGENTALRAQVTLVK